MDRWQGSQWSFSSHIFNLWKRKNFLFKCLPVTALWVTLPTTEQHQEGKVRYAVEFHFPPFFPIIFTPFCIDSNALNSVVVILNLNYSSKGLSANEWTKGVSCLCAVRTLHRAREAEMSSLSILLIIFIMEKDKCLIYCLPLTVLRHLHKVTKIISIITNGLPSLFCCFLMSLTFFWSKSLCLSGCIHIDYYHSTQEGFCSQLLSHAL